MWCRDSKHRHKKLIEVALTLDGSNEAAATEWRSATVVATPSLCDGPADRWLRPGLYDSRSPSVPRWSIGVPDSGPCRSTVHDTSASPQHTHGECRDSGERESAAGSSSRWRIPCMGPTPCVTVQPEFGEGGRSLQLVPMTSAERTGAQAVSVAELAFMHETADFASHIGA